MLQYLKMSDRIKTKTNEKNQPIIKLKTVFTTKQIQMLKTSYIITSPSHLHSAFLNTLLKTNIDKCSYFPYDVFFLLVDHTLNQSSEKHCDTVL